MYLVVLVILVGRHCSKTLCRLHFESDWDDQWPQPRTLAHGRVFLSTSRHSDNKMAPSCQTRGQRAWKHVL